MHLRRYERGSRDVVRRNHMYGYGRIYLLHDQLHRVQLHRGRVHVEGHRVIDHMLRSLRRQHLL
jgi:hypothetical protein